MEKEPPQIRRIYPPKILKQLLSEGRITKDQITDLSAAEIEAYWNTLSPLSPTESETQRLRREGSFADLHDKNQGNPLGTTVWSESKKDIKVQERYYDKE